MENDNKQLTTKGYFMREDVQKKFRELLGKRSTAFVTSVMQIIALNDKLAKAEPVSVYNAACMAAILDLPLNQNLGFAYIIPFNIDTKKRDAQGNKIYQVVAQFQIGYKGFNQLAQRSGSFKFINADDVRIGEIGKRDRLTGKIDWNWIQDDEKRAKESVVGYFAHFELLTGFEKTLYMTNAEIAAHGSKYSKTYAENWSLWKTDLPGMSKKTVLKLLLNRFAPLSVEMQRAITVDQAVINDIDNNDFIYEDSPSIDVEVLEQWGEQIKQCKTKEEILQLKQNNIEVIEGNSILHDLFVKAALSFDIKDPNKRAKALAEQTELLLNSKNTK